MLDLAGLKAIPAGIVFAEGLVANAPDGVYMSNNRVSQQLMWVARKGGGHDDWAIYIHWADMGRDYVLNHGDKVMNDSNIQKLVPCTKEVIDRYRF